MALLNKLKSLLGIGGSRSGDERTDTSVTVEREASDATQTRVSTDDTEQAGTAETADESAAAGTDATASTGSMTEPEPDETETATEPSEATGPPTEAIDGEPVNRDVEDVIEEAEASSHQPDPSEEKQSDSDVSDDEPAPAESTAAADEADDEPSRPVTAIKGIGPAYSDRLDAAGIVSVDELAEADVETTADEIGVSPKIVSDWVDRAREQ